MKVDFYILEEATRQTSWLFAARLLEKMFADKKNVYVHTTSTIEAERLNQFFWTYRDDSFLPHQIQKTDNSFSAPINIGYTEPQTPADILFNLSGDIPAFYQQFPQIIEIVFSDTAEQQLARERFRRYREQGCEMMTHKIKASDV